MTTAAPHYRRGPLALLLGVISLLSGACGGSIPTEEVTPTPATTSPADGTPDAVVDLTSRTVDIEAGGWAVAFCEGEAPFICVSDGSDHIGVVEYAQWPLTSGVAADALADGGTEADALAALANDFLLTMQEDRRAGCGDDYHVTAGEAAGATVAGNEAIRYGFTASLDGRTVEHVIIHATITGSTLTTFTAAGYEPGGCLPREAEFSVEDLETFNPILTRLVAAAQLPAPGIEAEPETPVAEDAKVELYDCTQACRTIGVPLSSFLDGTVRPYGGDQPLVTIRLTDGRITHLAEQYLP